MGVRLVKLDDDESVGAVGKIADVGESNELNDSVAGGSVVETTAEEVSTEEKTNPDESGE